MSDVLSKLRAEARRDPQQPLWQAAVIEILELRIELREALQMGYGAETNWPGQALALLGDKRNP